MVHVSMESFFLLCITIVGTHIRILRVTISQNHVGHEHTCAYLKSNAVKMNFHIAPHACWSVCLGTVDTYVLPLPEQGDLLPLLGWMESCRDRYCSSSNIRLDKHQLGSICKPICLHCGLFNCKFCAFEFNILEFEWLNLFIYLFFTQWCTVVMISDCWNVFKIKNLCISAWIQCFGTLQSCMHTHVHLQFNAVCWTFMLHHIKELLVCLGMVEWSRNWVWFELLVAIVGMCRHGRVV